MNPVHWNELPSQLAIEQCGNDEVTMVKNTFHWSDYLVFTVYLVAILGIGVYQAVRTRKKEDAQDYLVGGRSLSMLPVSISLLTSFLSAISILGTPAEMYTQGTEYWISFWGMMIACVLAMLLFVPLLYPLNLVSSSEYLEIRFKSKAVKLIGTLMQILWQMFYVGVALYSPATALEAVTGFPEWAAIVIAAIVSIVYVALGGMRASVWTSVVQGIIMLAGVIAIIIKGCIDLGGIENVWMQNYHTGRINFFDFDPNPLQRHTFWTLVVGNAVSWTYTYGVNQSSVQRYCSVKSSRAAKTTVLLNIPGLLIFVSLCCLAGIVVFAWYNCLGCDPLTAAFVDNPNQIIPYYVMDRLNYPTIPGLFLACLFSGSLSTVAAAVGATSAVTWDMMSVYCKNLSRMMEVIVLKLLVIFYGAIGMGMAFMCQNLGGTVLQMSLSFTGSSGGPILGMFILGSCFPCANWIGAVIGSLVGLAIPLWISLGSYTVSTPVQNLNFTVENCANLTFANSTDSSSNGELSGLETFYQLSYLWYASIGVAITVVLGLLVSMVTGCTDPSEMNPDLHLPFFDRLFCCLPNKTLEILRCKIRRQVDLDQTISESTSDSWSTSTWSVTPKTKQLNNGVTVKKDSLSSDIVSSSQSDNTSDEILTDRF